LIAGKGARWIAACLWVGAVTLVSAEPIKFASCCASLDRAVRSHGLRYAGPLIDAHAHLDPGSSKTYRDEIYHAAAGGVVDGLVLMPTPNHARFNDGALSTRQMADLATHSAGAIKNVCGSEDWNVWMGQQRSVSDSGLEKRRGELQARIASGACIGIGEIATRHFEKWAGQAVLTVDFRSRALHALFAIAQVYGVPIDLHVEPMDGGHSHEQQAFTELDEIFIRYPNITVILAHTAMTSATNVERLIEQYPRLYFSIKAVGRHKHWHNLEPISLRREKKAYFYEDWAQLLERYPERFFLGSDYKFARKIRNSPGGRKTLKKYRKLISRYRDLLGSLEHQVARQIAWDTPRRLFNLD
jgi:hypothetical protein